MTENAVQETTKLKFAYYVTLWMPSLPVQYRNKSRARWEDNKALATPYDHEGQAIHYLKELRQADPGIRNFTQVSYLTYESPIP